MTLAIAPRPSKTSAFTYLEQSPTASAEDATSFAYASRQPPGDGWARILDQLIDIGRLQDDWDGSGSPAPDRGVVAGATKLAVSLRLDQNDPPGRVTASVNGTICFEWHTSDGYREVEVTSPVEAEMCWVASGAATAEVRVLAIA